MCTIPGADRPDSTRARCARLWVALTVLSLIGCRSELTPESYYPLQPGLVRRYVMSGEMAMFAGWALERSGWHRATRTRPLDNFVVAVENQTKRLVNGHEATPIMGSSDFNRDYWYTFAVADDQGVAEVGRQKRGGEVKALAAPNYMLRFPIKIGRSWDVKEPYDFLDSEVMMDGVARIAGVDETVTVPAGSFRNCVRVETETSGGKRVPDLHGKGIAGEASIERHETTWLAPKIGIVKGVERITVTPAALGSGEVTLELTEIKGMPH